MNTYLGNIKNKNGQVLIKVVGVTALLGASFAVMGHHSFSMYDSNKEQVITGIVTRIDPSPNHLQAFIAPLNEARDQVLRDEEGEPIVWAIEMKSAAQEARTGVTVNALPRGSIVSVGLHPLVNGYPGGGRGEFGFFKCPDDTPPEPSKHCDSVDGNEALGTGSLPTHAVD